MNRRLARWMIALAATMVVSMFGVPAKAVSTYEYTFDRPDAHYWVSPGGSVSISVYLTEAYTGASVLQAEGGLLTAGFRVSFDPNSPATRTIQIANSNSPSNPYGTGAATDPNHFDWTSTFYDAASITAHDPTLANPIAGVLGFRDLIHPIGAGGLAGDIDKGPNTYSILLGTLTFEASTPAIPYTQVQQNIVNLADLFPNDPAVSSNTTTWNSGYPLDSPGGPGIASADATISVVPEPPMGIMTGGLLLMGGTLAGVYRLRRRSRRPKKGPRPDALDDDYTSLE